MLKKFADAWYRNREKLKVYFETHTQEQYGENYQDLLKAVIRIVLNDPQRILDENAIIEHGGGNYQGDYLWLIPVVNAWPRVEEYIFCYASYGSCSACDALAHIFWGDPDGEYGEGTLPGQKQVRDYMMLSLQILQTMKPLVEIEERLANEGFDAEPYMTGPDLGMIEELRLLKSDRPDYYNWNGGKHYADT